MWGQSGMTITPKDWGPFVWHVMYVFAVAMPDQPSPDEKKAFAQFIRSLPNLLPCSICRNEFAKVIQENPPSKSTESREEMVHWVLMAHNKVRARQGKQPLTTNDVTTMIIDNHRKNQAWPTYSHFAMGVGVTLLFVAAYVYVYPKVR